MCRERRLGVQRALESSSGIWGGGRGEGPIWSSGIWGKGPQNGVDKQATRTDAKKKWEGGGRGLTSEK
jgi:hypothetical protein